MTIIPQEILDAAKSAEDATKCPSYLTLAQWALESGWGRYLSAPYNSFGIKWYPGCGFNYRSVKTREQKADGSWIVVTARFIAFPSVRSCFTYHGRIIMNPHGAYASALPLLRDWQKFVHAVAKIYATDQGYADKLIQIITENHLQPKE